MVDRIVYVGYYLSALTITVKCEQPEIGCPICKTHESRQKFCGNCGHAIEDYSRPKTIRYLDGLITLAEDQGVIEDADKIFENFLFDGSLVIALNAQGGAGLTIHSDFSSEVCEIPELDEQKALDLFKDIIHILNHYSVPFKMKKGIVLTCR